MIRLTGTKPWFSRALKIVVAGLLLAIIATVPTHGEFHSLLNVLTGQGVTSVALLSAGAILQAFQRTAKWGGRLLLCGFIVLVSVPASFAAGLAVTELDLWLAKRYIASTVVPALEHRRTSTGRYPGKLWEHPPPDSPWLLGRFHYSSTGNAYFLSVMSPAVCGLITTYSSTEKRWREFHDPCFY